MIDKNITVGDHVQMKKVHPCGSDLWEVTRLGADITMICTGCKRQIQIPRSKLAKSMKRIIEE